MNIKTKIGNYWLELEAETPVDALEKLATFAEVCGETHCRKCNSERVSPSKRYTPDGDMYLMLHCHSCGSQIDVGQAKKPKGDVFVRRFNKDVDPNDQKGGWYHYKDTSFYKNRNSGGGSQQQSSGGQQSSHDEEPF